MSRRQTQNRSYSESVDPNLTDSIKECVRFILCKIGNKLPLKRPDITSHLHKTCQTPANQIKTVIIEADKFLKRVYGYKLVQVEASGGINYIVVLVEECKSLTSPLVDSHHRQLLVAALTHIYMTGAPVKDDDMWNFLTEAQLLHDISNKKLLTTTFTRQMYLTYSKVGEGDQIRHVFDWGQRAIEEVPKMFLLQKMAEAFEKTPDHWCEQYKEATGANEAT